MGIGRMRKQKADLRHKASYMLCAPGNNTLLPSIKNALQQPRLSASLNRLKLRNAAKITADPLRLDYAFKAWMLLKKKRKKEKEKFHTLTHISMQILKLCVHINFLFIIKTHKKLLFLTLCIIR